MVKDELLRGRILDLKHTTMNRRSTRTRMVTEIGNQRRTNFHSSIPSFIVITTIITIISVCQQSSEFYGANAFTTIQQQQQQQQNDHPNSHVPTNLPPYIQIHRSLSSTTANSPFKVAASAISRDSYTTPRSIASPSTQSATTTSAPMTTSSSSSSADVPDKNVVIPVPSLGFGGGGISSVAVTPFTREEEVIANYQYYYQQQMMQLADDDDDDEALMGLGTALVTCALSLVIGFGLGYGT